MTLYSRIKNSPMMFWSLEILIVVAVIWACTKISFLFAPIGTFFQVVFIPILLAGILYYLLSPVVRLLEKIKIRGKHISHTWSVTVVFLVLLAVLILGLVWLLPRLIQQVANMISNIPALASTTQDLVEKLANQPWLKNVDLSQYMNEVEKSASTYASSFLNKLTESIGTVISTITSFAVVAITVPVMLFYMLKDGHKFLPSIKKIIPTRHADQTIDLLSKMSKTISKYIGGQIIECLFVGTFTAIGYVLVGQGYALLLGVFAGICNIIPYVGPYIGILPALIVAFGDSTLQILYVVIVVLVVQQVDGNVVYPNIIGKTLKIHPLTIIVILLAAGNIAGLMGMILAIPLYAVVKVMVQYFYNIWQLQSESRKSEPEKPKEKA